MAANEKKADSAAAAPAELTGGAYEIIRHRLQEHGSVLRERVDMLNAARCEVFGAVEARLTGTERVLTANNCVPRDMVAIGRFFLFGFNVQLGLRTEMTPADVFAVYEFTDHAFTEAGLELLADNGFRADFAELYRYYKNTRFSKFAEIGPYLYMVFRIGKDVNDVKCFKWLMSDDGGLRYIDNRSDHEYRYPPQHEFTWIRGDRDMQRQGAFPHISFQDRIFVETVNGDLTVKIEDNTASGEGIYREPVADKDQTLDDAEFFFAPVGNLILLKIRPYREEHYRYIVYSEKVRQARRMDAIAGACVLLPEDHGIIFPNGYYLQTGEYKQFDNAYQNMLFERRIASPNGEDYLYIFYNRDSGVYVLLSYNIIQQRVEIPVECHGFCLFKDGELTYFKAQEEPSKSHVIQIWQTPFTHAAEALSEKKDSLLFKIGNRDIVRCMASCRTLLNLLHRDDSYANLYLDVSRLATELLDGYFWLREKDTFALNEPLEEIRAAAATAIGEFEKVRQLKNLAADRFRAAESATAALLNELRLRRHDNINAHVETMSSLRALRGQVISLRELKYIDLEQVAALENQVCEQTDIQARRCVDFLLRDDAMVPYAAKVAGLDERIESLSRVQEGEELRREVEAISGELEMLVEIVSNLKIDDATQRTRIIDGISALFVNLNQARAALQNRIRSLASVEGQAEFASQMKLLSQAVINYLDVCDSPEKCQNYLGRVMLQLEELEGKFADFEEYIAKLAEKREEVYNAFETRRLALVESRNRKADALQRSGERILGSIRGRIEAMKRVEDINGYFAADLLVEKLRGIINQLLELEDPVKAGDLQTKLKSLREDAVRQLHDRQELFAEGENIIKFGQHRFAVNTQNLDLTIVHRGDDMLLHLTGTNFFEPIRDPEFLATKPVWKQELVSESQAVYRAEYLAYQLFVELSAAAAPEMSAAAAAESDQDNLAATVQTFMAPRYVEGYQKGVHDEDALAVLRALLEMHQQLGLLRTHAEARALALVFWAGFSTTAEGELFAARLRGVGAANQVFSGQRRQTDALAALQARLLDFAGHSPWFAPRHAPAAADYLFDIVAGAQPHPISAEAGMVVKGFLQYLRKRAAEKVFADARTAVNADIPAEFGLIREWLQAYLDNRGETAAPEVLSEAAALLLTDAFAAARIATLSANRVLEGLRGSHPRLQDGCLKLNYNEFMDRLQVFAGDDVPRFNRFVQLKKELLDRCRREMRLDEFKPRVMTSFVRNRLIDKVYLPLIGANLAKQIGVAGHNTRTDRMGMLMLISPPGYGKTTLMEYVANRLGVVFMKINGPAIGHRVVSLDPAEAPNAAAREELHKLGLALEMGDNVMLYLDDIQHCHPEFLQKFISLCDAQRKIEGVYKGQTRTYDLRGKKVAVVMAGNPYTESGDKFRIPDMLANRADTYNLGDILGGNIEVFKLSFLENALTSNPALNRLAAGSRKDVHTLIRMAETGVRDGAELEGNFAAEELAEILSVLEKIIRVREVVLRVNEEYIRSAGQADEFRTEPPFKLQGSYRNMNRLAEKVQAVMNPQELETLIYSEYENEAQVLTTGAEANLLKFKEILNLATEAEEKRWNEIKKTFCRNQLMRGVDEGDRMGQAIAQLAGLGDGLQNIREAVSQTAAAGARGVKVEAGLNEITMQRLETLLAQMREAVRRPETEANYQELLRQCRLWRDDFLVPLREQSKEQTDDNAITRKVHLGDLDKLIQNINDLVSIHG